MAKQTFKTVLCLLVVSLLALTGCMTTTQKGTAVGAGVGAGIGAGIGALTGHAGMGALIGTGSGAIGGALIGDHLDKKREEEENASLERMDELEEDSAPKVKYE